MGKMERLYRSLVHPKVGAIWCLHRVVAQRSPMPANRELEITPDFLSKTIEWHLDKGYRFVDIDTLQTGLKHRRHQKQINISFDDGFEDIYTNAFPIFKHYNTPFTLYLSTGMPESQTDLWWIQLEQKAQGNIEWFETIMKQCYASAEPMADTMHRLTLTEPDFDLCKQMTLTWNQINEMVDSGLCTIGSHTHGHMPLTRIAPSDIEFELTRSQKIIQEKTGQRCHHFSYPHSMMTDLISQKVAELGYSSAVLGYGGSVRYGTHPFSLPRIYITEQ